MGVVGCCEIPVWGCGKREQSVRGCEKGGTSIEGCVGAVEREGEGDEAV